MTKQPVGPGQFDRPAPLGAGALTAPALLKLFTHTGDAVVVVDRQLRVVMANGVAQQAFGQQACDWLGTPCYRLFDCGVTTGSQCWILDSVLAGQPIARHTLPARLCGDRLAPVTISTLAVPLAIENGPYLVHVFETPDPTAALPPGRAAVRLRVHCLGEFRVVRPGPHGGETVRWGRKKVRDLFKYLVVHRQRWVRREELMELFWPELPPPAAAHNLRVTLSSLRRSLDLASQGQATGGAVVVRDTLVRLIDDGSVWVDVAEFEERAQRAAAHPAPLGDAELTDLEQTIHFWGGDLLPEDIYEDWTVDERERVLGLYLNTVRRLAHELCRRRLTEPAVRWLGEIVRCLPADEASHRQLMTELVRAGRRTEALRHYQTLVDFLRRELAVAPAPETELIYQWALTGQAPPVG